MSEHLIFRQMLPGEEESVCNMIRTVFNEFVAPEFSVEGVNIFINFVSAENMKKRHEDGNQIILASKDSVVGALEIRDKNHIALFFVDKNYHRRGIGRKLMQVGLERAKTINPEIKKITVNSSVFAVPVYEKLGFQVTEELQISHGTKYVPMAKLL